MHEDGQDTDTGQSFISIWERTSDGNSVGGPGGLNWTPGGEWTEFGQEWVVTAMSHTFGPMYGYHKIYNGMTGSLGL